ncbi:MAG: hypothetical protein ND807_05110, partial [Vicinamibacterales bacterium]|nr:hypothetical protein [Vicinamibacterales bacterium]
MTRILSIADPDRGKRLAHLSYERGGADVAGTAVLSREEVAEPALPSVEAETVVSVPDEDVLAPYRRRPDNQWPREHRLTPVEVPLLSAVKLSWGPEVSLLNISSTGLLVETTSRFTPGSVAEFQLCGPTNSVVVPARFVRSEIASVDSRSVKYHAAAVFTKGLHLPTFLRPDSSSTSKALADLLAHVLADLKRGIKSSELRGRFEHGLRRLVSA